MYLSKPLMHTPLFWHGFDAHSSIFTSQYLPLYPCWHWQSNVPALSIHFAPFWQYPRVQRRNGSSHSIPVYSGGQRHANAPIYEIKQCNLFDIWFTIMHVLHNAYKWSGRLFITCRGRQRLPLSQKKIHLFVKKYDHKNLFAPEKLLTFRNRSCPRTKIRAYFRP